MRKWGLSQEVLKLIACVTMLLDHIGATMYPTIWWLRVVGRIAFPVYCFLLAEGIFYTKKAWRYGLRLGIGAVLSEVPFDLALFGALTAGYQSVMVTLLLGFAMGMCMKQVKQVYWKVLMVLPFAWAAELLSTDYGGLGVVLIAMFVLTRDMPLRWLIQALGLGAICLLMDSPAVFFAGIIMPIEMYALLAMVPICLYSGKKVTGNPVIQWGFYLFYPIHLTVLLLIR